KMSKSDPSDMSRINLSDDGDTIAQKFRKARTDPQPLPESYEELKDRPEARNLVDILAALQDRSPDGVMSDVAGQGWGQFKPYLADVAVETIGPITNEMNRLLADPSEIDRILSEGAERASALAAPILAKTFDIMGMVHRS
ncbi:MAG: tryptophan--tRNA ligase, partial [Pseudomonadota bacterium]